MTKTLHDTSLVFQRAVRQTIRNPVWVFILLAQPLFYLVFFGPLLERVTTAEGFPEGGAFNVFVPGLLVQLALFGTAFVGFNLVAELRYGVIERLQVTPVSRLALLLGRSGRDLVVLLLQCVLLVAISVPFGLDLDVGGVAIALGLLLLVGLTFSSLSYTLALILKSEDALAPVLNGASLPIILLSGVLLPLTLAPAWLQHVADVNPLSHAVEGVRALFNGQLGDASALRALLVMLACAVISVAIATRRFRRSAA
jgi:ABC-2 type transport system permease protein